MTATMGRGWPTPSTTRSSRRSGANRLPEIRWLHEIKYDGYRIGCVIDKKGARLISRNGKDWTHVFPSIAEAAQQLKTRDAIIDAKWRC
jgi:bifunctional non-homologous end joining protein LigD